MKKSIIVVAMFFIVGNIFANAIKGDFNANDRELVCELFGKSTDALFITCEAEIIGTINKSDIASVNRTDNIVEISSEGFSIPSENNYACALDLTFHVDVNTHENHYSLHDGAIACLLDNDIVGSENLVGQLSF